MVIDLDVVGIIFQLQVLIVQTFSIPVQVGTCHSLLKFQGLAAVVFIQGYFLLLRYGRSRF